MQSNQSRAALGATRDVGRAMFSTIELEIELFCRGPGSTPPAISARMPAESRRVTDFFKLMRSHHSPIRAPAYARIGGDTRHVCND
jgi:hypothetical protein